MKRFNSLSYIANNRIPSEKAHSIYVLRMCDAFASLKLDVELVLPFRFRDKGEFKHQNIFETYSLKNKFRISRLPSPDFLPLGKIFVGILRIIYPVQSLFFATIVLMRALIIPRRALYITCDLWVAFILSLSPSMNISFDMQIIPYSKIRGFIMRFIIRRGVPVVSLTNAIKEILVEDFNASQKKVINLHDGFDETLFHPRLNKPEARRKCAFSGDLYIIGYVGKFTTMGESKGVEKLIEAVRLLKDKRCMLLLVGDDEWLLPVHNDINIVVIPHVPQSKLLPYLRSCDVVTMPFPRTPHYEKCMSPMKLFEYMASGVPVITTDLPSVREVVGNEDVLFIRDDSPQEIADAITSLRNNPAKAKSLADSALKKASQYTWYKRAESFIAFLSKP